MARKPEKRRVQRVASDYVEMKGTRLEQMKQQIDQWIVKYGTDAYFYYDYYEYDGGRKIQIRYTELETDAEFEKRLASEKKERDRKKKDKLEKEEYERKEYERLRKKYGEDHSAQPGSPARKGLKSKEK